MEPAKRLVVILGAGASVDAGLPTATELTAKLGQLLKDEPGQDLDYATVWGIARDYLQARFQDYEISRPVNYEDILSLLVFGAYPPDYDAATALVDPNAYPFKDMLSAINPKAQETETRVVDLARPAVNRISARRIELNGMAAVVQLVYLPKILNESGTTDYLQPLINAGSHGSPLVIASLNYDQVIESACESIGKRVRTFIDVIDAGNSIDFDDDAVNLLKLHGSMSWRRVRAPDQSGAGPTAFQLRESKWKEGESLEDLYLSDPEMIWNPRHKVTLDSPYLELFLAFRKALLAADRLLIIGYSFGDRHINQELSRWAHAASFRRSATPPITVIEPSQGLCHEVESMMLVYPEEIRVIPHGAAEGIRQLEADGYFRE